jgi:hypothetical protein
MSRSTGSITGELPGARRLLDRLAVPWRAVPGNHEIGDNPWHGAPGDSGVDPGRLVRWAGALGPDRWALDIQGWTLIALNTQLFGSAASTPRPRSGNGWKDSWPVCPPADRSSC